MADTRRTIASLISLFADNTAGAISEQDARDLIATMKFAAFSWKADPAVSTTIAAVDTPVVVNSLTVGTYGAAEFSMPANGRIQWDGAAAGAILLFAATSWKADADGQDLQVKIVSSINGGLTQSVRTVYGVGTGNAVSAPSIFALDSCSVGESYELWVANLTSDADVTMQTYSNMAAIFLPT